MAFNDFVQIELPKRPFTEVDGLPGQTLVRSSNVLAPRELVWVDTDVSVATYTAGIALSGQRAVVLNSSKQLIYATNSDVTHAVKILGITLGAALAGGSIAVQREGVLNEVSWTWTPGLPIFLGDNGALTQTPPASPSKFSITLGFAEDATTMLVSIGTPINLL